MTGGQSYEDFGASVAGAGDVDGDGYADVLVGAPFYGSGQTREGRVYLFRGAGAGLEASPSWDTESDQANARLGSSVASAGDIDGLAPETPDFHLRRYAARTPPEPAPMTKRSNSRSATLPSRTPRLPPTRTRARICLEAPPRTPAPTAAEPTRPADDSPLPPDAAASVPKPAGTAISSAPEHGAW